MSEKFNDESVYQSIYRGVENDEALICLISAS